MTVALVRSWCEGGAREIARGGSPGVQPVEAITNCLQQRVGALHAVADAVYGRWTRGLKR